MEERMSNPILTHVAWQKLVGKSPVGLYLRLNRMLWQLCPSRVHNFYPMRAYGAWLHSLIFLHVKRQQFFGTFFLRNRPALELMRRLADQRAKGAILRIAVLACSIGAEVYSILWAIRSARPDLRVLVSAVDMSPDVLDVAKNAVYAPDTCELVGSSIFERLTAHEMAGMFDWQGDQARVKSWLREGVTWQLGDASDPDLIRVLGRQDIVVANNFLCHMEPTAAENCLRNVAGLVDRNGYIFVSGVDLEVRAKVARVLGWRPVPDLIEEIHDGDPSVRRDWPCEWWGLEPIDKRRVGWRTRYAAVFRPRERN